MQLKLARELRLFPSSNFPQSTLVGVLEKCASPFDMDIKWGRVRENSNQYSSFSSTQLTNALTDVFRNIKRYSVGPIDIAVGPLTWGGLKYQCVNIEHQINSEIGQYRAANAYRIPIVSVREPAKPSVKARTIIESRLGAFTAASIMRALGGDIYMATQGLKTRISVLVPPASKLTS